MQGRLIAMCARMGAQPRMRRLIPALSQTWCLPGSVVQGIRVNPAAAEPKGVGDGEGGWDGGRGWTDVTHRTPTVPIGQLRPLLGRTLAMFDAWVPPELRDADPAIVRSAHLALSMAAATCVWGPVFCGVYLALGMVPEALVVLAGTLYLMPLPLVLWRTGSLPVAAHHTASALWLVVFSLSLLSGGLHSSAPPWLLTLSFIGLAIGGWRAGRTWLVISVSTVCALGAADLVGLPMRQAPAEVMGWLRWSSLLGSSGFLFVLGIVFQLEAESMGRRMQQQVAQLSEANRAKSLFLANMSHELRTPLNAIIGYSELIAEDLGERGEREVLDDLDRVRSASRHLLSLIDDLLDLSRIEVGAMELDIREHDLGELCREVVDRILPLAQSSGTELVLAVDGGTAFCDRVRTAQIVTNLVHNAVKFGAGGRVEVRCHRVDDDLRVEVTDQGPGLTAEELARVFEEFQQAHPAVRARHGGTGLGLTISRRLARAMGGDVVGRCAPGQGCTFCLALPSA